MKFTSTTSSLVLLGAIASSTVHTGLAVARPVPVPGQASTSTYRRSGGLLVDREGNLYSSPSSKTTEATTSHSKTTSANYFRRGNNIAFAVASALQIRGGHLSVDNEGNLYTPTTKAVPNQSHSHLTPAAASSPTEALRGGNQNNARVVEVGIGIGGLCVDSEGQFYFAAGNTNTGAGTSAASRLKTLRGGSLCVDNEGNLYSPRRQARAEAVAAPSSTKSPLSSSSRRRYGNGSDSASGPVLLAKNNKFLPKKAGKPKKSSYHNNARMET